MTDWDKPIDKNSRKTNLLVKEIFICNLCALKIKRIYGQLLFGLKISNLIFQKKDIVGNRVPNALKPLLEMFIIYKFLASPLPPFRKRTSANATKG